MLTKRNRDAAARNSPPKWQLTADFRADGGARPRHRTLLCSEANAKASALKRRDFRRWAKVSCGSFNGHTIGRFLPLNVWRVSNP
jgi:hypothetical protein